MRVATVGLKAGQVDAIALTLYARKFLNCITELVVSALECPEGIPESGLSNKLQCNLAHPIGDVDLVRATRQH